MTSKSERTRSRILEVASALFARKSFDGVSLRAIAREAGVDAALVHHYFGSKDQLFEEVLSHGASPNSLVEHVTALPREDWGAELVRSALALMDSPAGPAMRAVLRSGISSHPDLLRRFVGDRILGRLTQHLDGSPQERAQRAVLAGSQFVGLFVARYLVAVEPLASMPAEEVVANVGPTIQRYLTGPLELTDG
ncbi:TetR family transcriptional regulator [Tessaracoccus terricola]